MGTTLAMESHRLRSLLPVWILALVAVSLGVTASAFIASTSSRGTLTDEVATDVLTGGSSMSLLPFTGLPVLLLGVAAVMEDSRYRLATVLLVAQPRRSVLLAARLLLLAGIGIVVGLLQVALSLALSTALGRAVPLAPLPQVLGPYLITVVLLGWAGAALGLLTRSAAAPVALVLLDILLLEPLLNVAVGVYNPELEIYTKFLPFILVRDALAPDPVALAFVVVYAAALVTAAWVSVRTRDY